MPSTKQFKQLAINVGVLVATLAILFGIAEVLLRVLYIQPMSTRDVRLHRPSDIEGLVYEYIPGTDTRGFKWENIAINQEGFRGPARDASKPVIAVIGDSYAFGYGVDDDETNPSVLQQEFPEYAVVNAGVNGYNIEQQSLVMEHKVTPLNPELVIVEFVFNDMQPKGFFDENGIIRVGLPNDAAVKESITREGLLNFPGKFLLQRNSAVFNFIERTTKGLPFRKSIVDTGDTVTAEELQMYAYWFTKLDNAVQTKNKVFVIWPESNWHEESRAFLRKLVEQRGYIVVDLYDTLGNGYKSLGWDYHPHASVHEEAAKAIAETIRKKGLLPSE